MDKGIQEITPEQSGDFLLLINSHTNRVTNTDKPRKYAIFRAFMN